MLLEERKMTDFNEKNISNLFKKAKEDFNSDVNPFLKTKILANLASDQQNESSLSLFSLLKKPWLMFIQGGLVAVMVIFIFNQTQQNQIEGMVGQAYAINIELEKINKNSITFIKIELPNHVQFYSKSKRSDLNDKKVLVLSMSTLAAFEKLPVVIKSNSTGMKRIKLTLLDHKKNIVKEKQIKMNFTHSKELVF